MGEALMFGGGRTVLFDPAFEKTDWDKIIAACQSGRVPSSWKVGDQKPMTINGTDYLIDIIGMNHDDYADGSGKAPLTFQMHNCCNIPNAQSEQMCGTQDNTFGWVNAKLREIKIPIVLSALPTEVQAAIRNVRKLTSKGGNSSTIITSEDGLFLLSEIEIFGTSNYSYGGEGTQYAYYSDGNSKLKGFNGETTSKSWWTRSPSKGWYDSYVCVNASGGATNTQANTGRLMSFAFCF